MFDLFFSQVLKYLILHRLFSHSVGGWGAGSYQFTDILACDLVPLSCLKRVRVTPGGQGGNNPPQNTLPLSIECNGNIKFVSLAFSLLSSLSVCFFFYLRVWLFGTIMVTVTVVNCIWLVLAAACLIQAHFKFTSLHLKNGSCHYTKDCLFLFPPQL